MRKFKRISAFFAVLSLFVAGAAAKDTDNQNNLFKCVDDVSLELDSSCLSAKMESSQSFIQFQDKFSSDLEDLGGNVMSTILFYPDLMEIRVIAHLDKPTKGELVMHNTAQNQKD